MVFRKNSKLVYKMSPKLTLFFIFCFTLANWFDIVETICCHRVRIYNCSGANELQTLCPDCSKPTPYCGVTSCNLIGCNCDACRTQREYTMIDNLASTEQDDPINDN